MRFERKFEIEENFSIIFDSFLKSKNFIKHFPNRIVNSIYFDSNCFRRFHESEDGVSNREKCRIRFYNDDISNLILEYKVKSSEIGYKESKNVEEYLKDNNSFNITLKNCKNKVFQIVIPKKINNLDFPSLYVSYLRNYYISKDKNIRITIDKKILFSRLRNGSFINERSDSIKSRVGVLEVKYDYNVNDLKIIQEITSEFSLTLSRFSKYCMGIKSCY